MADEKGTVWGQGGTRSAADGARDVVSVVALTSGGGPKSVTVEIGASSQTFATTAGGGGSTPLSYFEMPFEGRAGPVTLRLGDRAKTGPPIRNECPPCGHVGCLDTYLCGARHCSTRVR